MKSHKMVYVRSVLFYTVIAILLVHALGMATIAKRSEASTENADENKICLGRTPCGWAIYDKTSRLIDYFMKNRCICEGEKKCLREEDDISVSAYVYRCKTTDDSDIRESSS